MNENQGDEMPVVFEKARVNVWNIAGFCVLALTTGFGWGVTYMRMDGAITTVRADTASVRAETKQTKEEFARSLAAIEVKLSPIASLQFQSARALEQVAEQKNSNEETNKRVDRVVDTFNNKMDSLIGAVNSLNVKVEVMNSQNKQRQGN